MTGLVLLAVLVVLATAGGLVWQRRNGRIRHADQTVPAPVLAALGADTGADVTLLQFSSSVCQPCRATRRILAETAGTLAGVAHVEVDVESHPDAVAALGIRRTPTTLVLDRRGAVVRRASGQPRAAEVLAALRPLLEQRPVLGTRRPDAGTLPPTEGW